MPANIIALPQSALMDRPVACYFCEERMFYEGDPRWVPEVRFDVKRDDRGPASQVHYAHLSCWTDNMPD